MNEDKTEEDVYMRKQLDVKSMLLGTILAASLIFAVGAGKNGSDGKEIFPVRFRVLEATTPSVKWQHGGQVVVLRLAPFHGKISRDSYDWRLKHETQELTLVTTVEPGYEIRKDDILGFQAYQHLRSSR
jgi:hypothetical protein